jgi:uncharacterized protein HemX
MDEFFSTVVLPIAGLAVVIFLGFASRSNAKRQNLVKRFDHSIELTKQTIQAEEQGTTVQAKKDKEYLQRQIREAQAAPKKYQKQAQEQLEQTKKYLEKKKQDRLEEHKRMQGILESSRDHWRGKSKGK